MLTARNFSTTPKDSTKQDGKMTRYDKEHGKYKGGGQGIPQKPSRYPGLTRGCIRSRYLLRSQQEARAIARNKVSRQEISGLKKFWRGAALPIRWQTRK